MAKRALPVDRIAWDAEGLRMRFDHYAPDYPKSDRAILVAACLNASAFGMEPEDFFLQIRKQIEFKRRSKAKL